MERPDAHQRGYVWTIERQIQLLWADIVERAKELERYQIVQRAAQEQGSPHLARPPRRHFLGTVIITEHRAGMPGEPITAEVIDGQQRMTTTQLLALAFRDAVADVEDEFYRKCVDGYTWNAAVYREKHAHLKVWPTNAGRQEMMDLVESRSLDEVCKRYPVVTIGSGKSKKRIARPLLTPADLVRNFVFLEATRINASAGKLYETHWRDFDELPAEKGAASKSKLFWKVEERQGRLTNTRLDTMLYHYVSMRTMNDVKLDHVFEEFKQWWLTGKKDVDRELARLKRAASLFRAMVLPDRSTRLGRFAHNLRVLDSSTVTPVVLFLGERLGTDSQEFLDCLTVMESYLVRRAVCTRTTKAYNRVFPALLKRLSEAQEPTAASVADHLKGLAGGETQDWPDDATFRKAWLELNTYKALRTAKTKMLLEALELGCRNEVYHESAQLPSVALHVEHVMPVAWEAHWPAAGDDTAVMVRNHLLHSIGNLTLLTAKLNPSLSNSAFSVKRPEITKSLLALNAHFQGSSRFPHHCRQKAC